MSFLYGIGYYIGYFCIMILFMVIAIICSKSKLAWIVYIIGSVIQLFSLIGNQKVADYNGIDTTLDWIIYFVLLIVSAVFIVMRHQKVNNSNDTNQDK